MGNINIPTVRESPFKRGDFFVTTTHDLLGKGIQLIQKYRTTGILSSATHSGLFLDGDTIFESLHRVKKSNVWDSYEGVPFLVGRWKEMDDEKFEKMWNAVKKYEGKIYPYPRLLMFLFFPIMIKYTAPSKFLGLGYFSDVVCSELVAYGLKHAGWLPEFNTFRGRMPPHLSQIIRQYRDIEIIHPKALLNKQLICV